MKKILINKCYGGFSVSKEVTDYLGISWDGYGFVNLDRDDPDLIEAVEFVGLEKASGELADLSIVSIPDDVEWTIEEYDGIEWIAESHRTWG
jgi:hypothetical protein